MGLFGKKKEPRPAPAPQPEPKQPEISGPPHEYFIRVDGQWYINPNYDPTAPKPPKVRIIGMDDDDEEDDEDDE